VWHELKLQPKEKVLRLVEKKNKSKELNCIGYPHDDPYGLIAAWWKIFSKPQGKKEAPKKDKPKTSSKDFY
tara:strand:+ start:1208 stop:1420 length:213 start_codon:yes stop_codon:yes gene_type:complete